MHFAEISACMAPMTMLERQKAKFYFRNPPESKSVLSERSEVVLKLASTSTG